MSVQEVHHHVMQMLHVKTKLAVISVFAIKVFLYLMYLTETENVSLFLK